MRRAWVGRTPMQKAPPKSLKATHGQGSLEWSIECVGWVCNVARKGRKFLELGGSAESRRKGGRWRLVETDEGRRNTQ